MAIIILLIITNMVHIVQVFFGLRRKRALLGKHRVLVLGKMWEGDMDNWECWKNTLLKTL